MFSMKQRSTVPDLLEFDGSFDATQGVHEIADQFEDIFSSLCEFFSSFVEIFQKEAGLLDYLGFFLCHFPDSQFVEFIGAGKVSLTERFDGS